MERLKAIKNSLLSCVESQMGQNLAEVDAKELGEVIDMIKDMDEAMYYCSVVKAMEESKEEQKIIEKMRQYAMPSDRVMYYTEPYGRYPDYRDMDRDYGRMYYSGGIGGNSGGRGGSGSNGGNSGGSRNYGEYNYPTEIRDVREGRSPMSRKNYMESKEMHKGTSEQMKELEKYMHELSEDLIEMIQDASAEEKAMLQQKLTNLASKIK